MAEIGMPFVAKTIVVTDRAPDIDPEIVVVKALEFLPRNGGARVLRYFGAGHDHVVSRELSNWKMGSSGIGACCSVDEPPDLASREMADVANFDVAFGIRGRIEWIHPGRADAQIGALNKFGFSPLRARTVAQGGQ